VNEPIVWVPLGLLTLVCLGLAVAVLRLRARVVVLEREDAGAYVGLDTLADARCSTTEGVRSSTTEGVRSSTTAGAASSTTEGTPVDEAAYVVTAVGDPEPDRRIEGSLFADLVLRESVVKGVSLVHGLRRALAPETRNRIRFQMRQEVKRARKQRRADLRAARRHLADRQRAAYSEDAA
jgi:hypothetical protein